MARLLIGIILLWGGFAIWINRNTEPLPSESYRNIQLLLSAAHPENDPTLPLHTQMEQARSLNFEFSKPYHGPLMYLPPELKYFVNLEMIAYVGYHIFTIPPLVVLDSVKRLYTCTIGAPFEYHELRKVIPETSFDAPLLTAFPNLEYTASCYMLFDG